MSASGPGAEGARVTILGSGTLLPDDRRRSAAHLLEVGERRFLLDCGSGTLHGFDRHGVAWQELDVLAFSHFHTDHIGDLAPVLFALKHGARPARTRPLTILGPPGLYDVLDALEAGFGEFVADPGFPVEVRELGRNGGWEDADGSVRLRFHPTAHTDHSVAHRWETGDGAAVGYTGDTGPDPALGPFLAGADVLVCEAAVADSSAMENHLSPREVAELARSAAPELLLTTHVYPPLEPGRVPELVRAAGYAGRVEAARDGTTVTLTGGGLEVRHPGRA